jgi:hypothetical protein
MMNTLFLLLTFLLITSAAWAQTPLSDGKTFTGWEGDTTKQWRIEEGAFTSGSLEKKQPYNDYLATTKEFGDFELTLKWKLEGTEGFVNGGVQFRSKRVPKGTEVSGFQADLGAGYDGALYDHIRRSKVIQRPTKEVLEKASKPVGEWNDYRVRAEGSRIQIWLNGVQTVDYTETDPTVETTGIIAVQIHGNSTAIVRYKDIAITELTAGHAIEPAAKVMLFDGKSLDGWIPFSPEVGKGKEDNSTGVKVWSVRDGVIHCEGKPKGYLRIKQADLDSGILTIASATKEAGHAAHIHHDAGFTDGGAVVRFKFPGLNKDESLQLGFVDRETKGIHAGHLCYGILSQSNISLMDSKTGDMNLEIRQRRQEYLDRKEKLPADLDALLKTKRVTVPWNADTDWHELVLVTEGDEMRLSLDGKVIIHHRSEGFAHPMKRWFSFLVPSTVWIEDVKIWKVN